MTEINRVGEAFLLFPVEVWEIVLGKLGSSRDILSVYQAYPELEHENVMMSKTTLGLFEQIIPQLFRWLSLEEILCCRLVCKRWSAAMDDFLETYTRNHLYEGDHTIWNFMQGRIKTHHTYSFYRAASFSDDMFERSPNKFLLRMASHPPERNPFVGRTVYIKYRKSEYGEGPQRFWDGILEMLRRFGGHIWFLRLDYDHPHPSSHVRYCELKLNILALVPNLKELLIRTCIRDPYWYSESQEVLQYLEMRRNSFPVLTQLETLFIHSSPSMLADVLVSMHTTQIRRLGIIHHLWRLKYSQSMFPNLEDFRLRSVPSKEELTDVLVTLNAPQLKSLDLIWSGGVKLNIVGDVVPFLSRFPQLQNLAVAFSRLKISAIGKPHCFPFPATPIQTIKSLTILVNKCLEVDINIYGLFPALEYLTLHYDYDECDSHRMGVLCPDGEKSRQLQLSEIWEMLPKLKRITVHESDDGARCTRYYNQANHKWGKPVEDIWQGHF